MTPKVIAELQRQEVSPFHKALLDHVKPLVRMSRSSMAKRYLDWDRQNMVYKGERCADKEDIEMARQGKPEKMVVPNTFAQVMTFSSFLFLMFNQNRNFFELVPSGDEDYGTKRQDCETILARDLRRNQFNTTLFQHLLDIGRFGPSILECSWTRQMAHVQVQQPATTYTYQGVDVEVRGNSEWADLVKYEGNLVRPISPYRFFPDTRFPLVDFQKGEFCASEEEYSKGQLRDLETAGEVAGVDHIVPLARGWDKARGAETRTTFNMDELSRGRLFLGGPSQTEGNVLVTKCQVWIVPNQFKWGPNDQRLGPETFRVLYHIWYANDLRIIRVEPAYWWHNEFGYTVAQFTPDMHQTLSLGLADLIYRLQDVYTWLINARITDVRRNLRGRRVVNPSIIDTKSLDGEGDIYLRKGANAALMERAVIPLAVNDVTQRHFSDAEVIGQIMEAVTGVNGNAMGQYSSGRRSALQTQVVTAGSAGRMKMHGQLIWETSLGRLGRLMLSNSRQSLSYESFLSVIGQGQIDPMTGQSSMLPRYQAFCGTPEEIVCGDDYMTFDSTLASEKGYQAQTLMNLLQAVISNPVAATQLDIDPRALLSEINYLQGAGPVSRFSLSKNVASGAAPLPTPPELQPQQEAPTEPQGDDPAQALRDDYVKIYKDTPEDVQRQIEQKLELQPSSEGGSSPAELAKIKAKASLEKKNKSTT